MPRYSQRAQNIREMEEQVEMRMKLSFWRTFVFEDEDSDEDMIDVAFMVELNGMKSNRYHFRRLQRRRSWKCDEYLTDKLVLSDVEFLRHFRMRRLDVIKVNELVKDDPALRSGYGNKPKMPPIYHLLVFLRYLGCEGTGASSAEASVFFGVGKGTINNCINRMIRAILRLKQVSWPDAEERGEIAHTIKQVFGFPGCVGITDGTLLPLAFRPNQNPEDYWTRKGYFAVNAMITCDHLARVRNVVVGWPGCVHDNRVFRSTKLNTARSEFFTFGEYLLGDSAFQPSNIMVPAFKKQPGCDLSDDHRNFNTMLARIRIRSEHSIGLLKARFPYFRSIRMKITDRKSMKKLVSLFLCAASLHNMLIGTAVPPQWEAAIEEYISLNEDLESEPYEAVVDSTAGVEGGTARREEVYSHMMGHFSCI